MGEFLVQGIKTIVLINPALAMWGYIFGWIAIITREILIISFGSYSERSLRKLIIIIDDRLKKYHETIKDLIEKL